MIDVVTMFMITDIVTDNAWTLITTQTNCDNSEDYKRKKAVDKQKGLLLAMMMLILS